MTTPPAQADETETTRSVLLFLCGDVMLGRGIDQILARPGDPHLHEPLVHSAIEYVELAEAANGPIPRAAAPEYIWAMPSPNWREPSRTHGSSIWRRA